MDPREGQRSGSDRGLGLGLSTTDDREVPLATVRATDNGHQQDAKLPSSELANDEQANSDVALHFT